MRLLCTRGAYNPHCSTDLEAPCSLMSLALQLKCLTQGCLSVKHGMLAFYFPQTGQVHNLMHQETPQHRYHGGAECCIEAPLTPKYASMTFLRAIFGVRSLCSIGALVIGDVPLFCNHSAMCFLSYVWPSAATTGSRSNSCMSHITLQQ